MNPLWGSMTKITVTATLSGWTWHHTPFAAANLVWTNTRTK